MTLQSLILGKQRVDTETQKRKILLGGYLVLTFLGVDIFFFILNTINPAGEPWSLFFGSFISLICLLLIRLGWINTAICLYLIRTNLITFYFSMIDEDPFQTATYTYFIPGSLGALAVFGYGERWKGISFCAFSFLLFLWAYLDPSRFAVNDAHFYFIVNFSIVLLIGILIVLFFDRLVVGSEKIILLKNEELTEANRQLVKANKELDRFVYSASHDLRAPLSSMLGLIEIIHLAKTPDEGQHYLDLLKGRVLVLESFIREIIDYSRNTRLEARVELVRLKDVIEEVVEQLRFLPGFASVVIELNIADGFQIHTDKSRLRVIFENLISNAVKYRNPYAEKSFLRISATDKEKVHVISVEDNGIGIPEKHVANVFDMFYRAHESSQGSGLGLFIVRETLDKLGDPLKFNLKWVSDRYLPSSCRGRVIMQIKFRPAFDFLVKYARGTRKNNMARQLIIILLVIGAGCSRKGSEENRNLLSYTFVKAFPHSSEAFTQGMTIENGKLYESTGQQNSWIAEVDIASGSQTKKVVLDKKYFGEGIAILNGKVYQLTWQSKIGFVYDLQTFEKIKEFKYDREGWGLTHNGKDLIMSDGTAKLYFLDTATLETKSSLTVKEGGQEMTYLNELEFIEGSVFANQWQTNTILRIDPANGKVTGRLDLTELAFKVKKMNPNADVLNGIAYERKSKTVLVTGKLWPVLIAFRLGSEH